MHLRKGLLKRHHFAHYAAANCEVFSEGETEEHLSAKELLYEWLTDETIEIEAYLPDLQQRPDLLVGKTAIEVQCSALSWRRFVQRTEKYLAYNYSPWWLPGKHLQPQLHHRWTVLQRPVAVLRSNRVLFVDHRYTRATRWSHIRDQLAL